MCYAISLNVVFFCTGQVKLHWSQICQSTTAYPGFHYLKQLGVLYSPPPPSGMLDQLQGTPQNFAMLHHLFASIYLYSLVERGAERELNNPS